MEEQKQLKSYFEILWTRRLLIIIVTSSCMTIAALINVLAPSEYKTTATILVTSPYAPDNMNLPNAPYSTGIFNDLFHNVNFRKAILDKLGKKGAEIKLTATKLEKMASLEFVPKNNIIRVNVEGRELEFLNDIVNSFTEIYVEQFNHAQKLEFLETKHKVGEDLKVIREELNSKEEEIKALGLKIDKHLIDQKYGKVSHQLSSYENELRDRRIALDGNNAIIQEIERQLNTENERPLPNLHLIHSLNEKIRNISVNKSEYNVKYNEINKFIGQLENGKKDDKTVSELTDYKKQATELNILLNASNAKINEYKKQIEAERVSPSRNKKTIDSLRGRLRNQTEANERKSAEYKKMSNTLVKLKNDVKTLNEKKLYYDTEKRKLERERQSVVAKLNSIEAKANKAMMSAKTKRMKAKVFELSSCPLEVKSSLVNSLAYSGIGGFALIILFLWICFI